MDEERFWKIIEDAWASDRRLVDFRDAALSTLQSEAAKDEFEEEHGDDGACIPNEDVFMSSIESSLDSLTQEDLRQFDAILEKKLFDIDRQEIHEFTDGSDDGFLYCRGFIVALGKTYYEAISATPSHAMFDWECEAMTYVSFHLFEKKFGEMPASEISRETCSNTACWPDE